MADCDPVTLIRVIVELFEPLSIVDIRVTEEHHQSALQILFVESIDIYTK